MRYCIAIGCSNKSGRGSRVPGVSFHRFPMKDPLMLHKWLTKLRRKDYVPSCHSVVCSEHFEKSDFIYPRCHKNLRIAYSNSPELRWIKKSAVPSKKLYQPHWLCGDNHIAISDKDQACDVQSDSSQPSTVSSQLTLVSNLSNAIKGGTSIKKYSENIVEGLDDNAAINDSENGCSCYGCQTASLLDDNESAIDSVYMVLKISLDNDEACVMTNICSNVMKKDKRGEDTDFIASRMI